MLFLDSLGVTLPIIQAPMAGVSTPALAAAVSNAGGLGSLGIGAHTAAQAHAAITATHALTQRPFNVNVFCHEPVVRNPEREDAWLRHLAPLFQELGLEPPSRLHEIYTSFRDAHDALLPVLLETRPAFVSFHFGLPHAHQLKALKQAGIITLATATSLMEAKAIEAADIDTVVAQGFEAGGHRGMFDPEASDEQLSTADLTRVLVNNIRLPIIAAGGIMDGYGIRAALKLGASAAQLGTAFLLCPESGANAAYRALLQSGNAAHTRLTCVISGRPARGMVNRFMDYGTQPHSPEPATYPLAYDAAKQLHAAAAQHGNQDFAAFWAGQGAPLCRALPAAELVACLVEEMNA